MPYLNATPYSYRSDPQVPKFDDRFPITVMDGECVLCTLGARMIARLDKSQAIKICRVQSPLGQALLRHYGLCPDNPESWLFIVEGSAYGSLDAMIRVGMRIGGPGWLLLPLRLLPRRLQDWLYLKIARNRYRFFGRTDMCAVPDAALRARLME